LYALLTGSATPLPSSAPVENRALRRIIVRATEADPARRYPSALEMQTDLTAWLEGRPRKRRLVVEGPSIAACAEVLTAGGDSVGPFIQGWTGEDPEKRALAFQDQVPTPPYEFLILRILLLCNNGAMVAARKDLEWGWQRWPQRRELLYRARAKSWVLSRAWLDRTPSGGQSRLFILGRRL